MVFKAIGKIFQRLLCYIRRLMFPLYLFPLKLLTYSVYYTVKFIFKLILAVLGLFWDFVSFPFRSLKNLLKSFIYVVIIGYLLASVFVITDYISIHYGWYDKFLCKMGVKEKMQNSVVRIVGGGSEGTGFFISPNQVMTNFHVIADEPAPKIII